MNRTLKKAAAFFFSASLICAGTAAASDIVNSEKHPIIPCGYVDQKPCEFKHLFVLVNNVINFALTHILVPVGVISIFIGGTYYMFSKVQEGKRILKNVAIGFGMALGAYLIVKLIVITLACGSPDATNCGEMGDVLLNMFK